MVQNTISFHVFLIFNVKMTMKLDLHTGNVLIHFSNAMTGNAFHPVGRVMAKKIALMVKMNKNVPNAMELLGSVD